MKGIKDIKSKANEIKELSSLMRKFLKKTFKVCIEKLRAWNKMLRKYVSTK